MPVKPKNLGRYPSDWALRSYFVRFVRARGRCEWCGTQDNQPHPQTGAWVILTTAHVHDQSPEASGLMNLAALCQRCHNRHDTQFRRLNRAKAEEMANPTPRFL